MKRETLERPAYMEYPANILAREEYRGMSLSERGLMYMMKKECWVNQEIPADIKVLAAYLHVSVSEIESCLPNVMWYFKNDGKKIACPSLEKYRDEQDARYAKQVEGGRRGASKTNDKRKTGRGDSAEDQPSGMPQVPRRAGVGSLDQTKPIQIKPARNDEGCVAYQDWVGNSPVEVPGFVGRSR